MSTHEHSGFKIIKEMKHICTFGNRWMGSSGEQKTRQHIIKCMEEAGYQVTSQPFTYLAFQDFSATFSIQGNTIPCEPLAYSNFTQSKMTAPIVYVGQGTAEDFNRLEKHGVDISKSIALSDNLRSFDAYPAAENAGALGFILATTLPGDTIRCGAVRFDRKLGKIPAVSISGNECDKIRSQIQDGKCVEGSLFIQGTIHEETGFNIRAQMSPPTKKRRLLLTAHYDSFWNGVHAMDNLAGVTTLLTLARELPSQDKEQVEFVFFGGEELGSWGAAGYVHAQDFSPQSIKGVINLDAFGSTTSSLEMCVTENFAATCKTVLKKLNIVADQWSIPPRTASDHKEFLPYDIPTLWIANGGTDARYHTPLDTVSRMNPEKLQQTLRIAKELVRFCNNNEQTHSSIYQD